MLLIIKIIEILKRFFKKTKKETVKETIEEITTIEENTKEEKEEEDNTYFNDGELYAEIRIVKDTRKRKRK